MESGGAFARGPPALTLDKPAEKLKRVHSRNSIQTAPINNLRYRKVSAGWIPKMVTKRNTNGRASRNFEGEMGD